jgi:hypothetical protein
VQLAALRPLIQRLNVFQPMFKPITAQIYFVLRDRVEHKRIVRIGRMAKRKGCSGTLFHFEFVVQTVFTFDSYTKRYALWSDVKEFSCSRLCVRGAAMPSAVHSEERLKYKKNSRRADSRAAAECIEETLTSLTALPNNSLIDCSLPVAWGGSSQAERLLSESARLVA